MVTSRKKRASRENRRNKVVSANKRGQRRKSRSFSYLNFPKNCKSFNPKEPGDYELEFIPFIVTDRNPMIEEEDVGSLHYEMTYWRHRGIGSRKRYVICPEQTFGNRCPICEHVDQLREEDYEANKKLIGKLYAQERQLFCILNHAEKKKGLQIWDVAYGNFGEVLDDRLDRRRENEELVDFHDPEDGMTLIVSLKEEKIEKTKYLKCNYIDFRARRSPVPQKFFDEAPVLDELPVEMSYDEIKNLLHESDDPDDEEEKPRRSSKKKARGRSESSETRTSAKKKKKTAKKRRPLTDDDDWDDDDLPF